MKRIWKQVQQTLRILGAGILAILVLVSSTVPGGERLEQVRAYTRGVEFDYAGWMLAALWDKGQQWALSAPRYWDEKTQRQVVEDWAALTREVQALRAESARIFADPSVSDPQTAAAPVLARLRAREAEQARLGALSEEILQVQTRAVLAEMGLTYGKQAVPSVLYRISKLPLALVVSPREVIRQDANISLLPDMGLDEITALEQRVEGELGVSALVVQIGGVAVYPTMVMETTNLVYLTDTVAHEWTHNYLTLRPLGMLYDATPELRSMNETAASLAGKEIGLRVLERYYPDLVPPPPAPPAAPQTQQPPAEPPAFDFRAEMHITRVEADRLLAEGKVDEAEAYMEARRQVFYANGYVLRRLNQAYFAFHGAYADTPLGAAGEDPVGPAVRALRAQSGSLREFLNRISWMDEFADLQKALQP